MAALAVRVAYVLQSQASPLCTAPQMDALYHLEWARALVRGEDYAPGPFFRAPGYPWFLAALTFLCGEGLLGPRLVQAAVGAGSCALVYALGSALFDRRAGLLAAAITALYGMLVYFDGELLLPVLEVPTTLAAVLCAVRAGDRPTAGRLALAGLLLGVAAIVRPNVLLWGAAVGGWLLFRPGATWAARARRASLYAAAALVPILPITFYNTFAGGDPVLISTQGGLNFWIGNNPVSDGSSAIAPGTRPDWWGGYHDAIAQAEVAEGRTLRPSEVSRHYAARAWSWIASEPLAAARHVLWKLRLYWTDHELGNNQEEWFFAREFGPVLSWAPFGFGLVAPLGLVGWALALRRFGRLAPAWMFVPAWCASVVAFFVCARFRIPMMPVLAVFAAQAVVLGFDALRARRWRALALGTVAAALLGLGVQAVPREVDRTPAKGLWQLGVLRAQAGDAVEAERLYRASIAANPRFALARQDLGFTLLAAGRAAEARASFEDALRLAPATFGAHQGRIEAAWALGLPADAVSGARDFVRAVPGAFAAHYTLARALLVAHGAAAADEARAALDRAAAHAREPRERFDVAFVRGELERLAGRPREALSAFEQALAQRAEPDAEGWYWTAQAARLELIAELGDVARARDEARALVARFPGDPRAAARLARWLAR
ncbi:MAG: glycosyltransferase family 39 protein [Planctomycetes bacterium]|nr:glycosyltransferase family 39 protein [Planctomycetota bacterium]